MAVLYIKEQGTMIKKKSERIVVAKNTSTLLEVPICNVENVAIIGNVQLSTQALTMLMENGIDINYFTFSGKYLGKTVADSSKNIFLRFSQYEKYNDVQERLRLARTIVHNKVNNQIKMIQKHVYDEIEYDFKADIRQLEKIVSTLNDKVTSNEIMGVEGICSNIYFSSFGKMFHCDFEFRGRNRRPPKDPINILISLGYTFLTKEVTSALEAESFEMYLGFLHGVRYGRKSLALDIVEEFRQPVIDQLVIRLCNKRMINRYDFEEMESTVMLSEEGFRKFCMEYEKYINGMNGVNYRKLIKKQANQLKRYIQKNEEYHPYEMGGGTCIS